jgi:MATE family multidrug resistance protein
MVARQRSRIARLRREVATTFALALPLVFGQLSQMAMNVIDTLLAGRHSALTLASVAVGTAVWTVVILVVIGVMMAVPPSVSQLNGARRRQEVGPLFRQALWIALSLGVALMLFVGNAGWLLEAVGVTPEVRPGALAFLRGIAVGAPAMALVFCFRYVSEGVALTRPTMVIGLGGVLLLLPLGYALLFGAWGAPSLGAGGLGLATAIVLWVQALAFVVYLARSPNYADLGLFGRFDPPRREPIRDLLRLGLPMGVSVFMEGSLFVATALIIASLGAMAVAAHQVAVNLAAVSFMIPLGVAMATTVRVGYAAGGADADGVRWAAGAGYTITAITQAGSALVLLLGADLIANIWTRDAEVAALAAELLVIAALFQFSDGLQAASAGALRGLKDTRLPMLVTVLAYWGFGMPLGWWLGIDQGMGPHGMWYGLVMGLSVAAALLTVRFWRLARMGPSRVWTEAS